MVKKESKSTSKDSSKIPEGLVILSVVCFAVSLVLIVYATSFFSLADVVRITPAYEAAAQGLGVTQNQAFFLGIAAVFFGLVFYFIGKGLLVYDNRARIGLLAIIVVGLAALLYASYRDQLFLIYSTSYLLILGIVVVKYLLKADIVKKFK